MPSVKVEKDYFVKVIPKDCLERDDKHYIDMEQKVSKSIGYF